MIIPPPVNTKEREEHDISGLRVLYLLCEDTGIAHEEHVQKAFLLLRKLVGRDKFLSEFTILQEYIEKQRNARFKQKRDTFEKHERACLEAINGFQNKK